jgi:hypothetical protein
LIRFRFERACQTRDGMSEEDRPDGLGACPRASAAVRRIQGCAREGWKRDVNRVR